MAIDKCEHSDYAVYSEYIYYERSGGLKIIVSNRSDCPIYEQIKEQVKDAIFAGTIKENDLLPSVRQLAKDLKISVITTTRAYKDLEEEGLVVLVQGKGCFVAPQNKELVTENALRKIEDSLQSAIDIAQAGGIGKAEILEILEILYKEGGYE